MSVILIIETSTTTAYLHSQKTHSQDVRKDVRYQPTSQHQSVSQSIDQTIPANQINQTSQPIDQPTPVIQTSPRQASLQSSYPQSLYPQLSYNLSYAAINQSYHPYNQSSYGPTNQYAPSEPPRSPYINNQIRFTPQAAQPNLSQSTQPPAPQPPQPPSSPPAPASAPQTVFESIHISQSFNESSQSFNDSNDWFRQLTLLNKIYKKNEKFNDTDSNFDFKVLKFYDRCRRAKLLEHAYLQNVSIILTNETLDYYYSNLRFCCYSFHEFCVNIKH